MLYVAGEILLWMVLAFVLGVLVGWFVWGVRRAGAAKGAKTAEATAAGGAPATAPTGDIESVTVRPAAKPVAAEAAAPPAVPITPPAGMPVVPPGSALDEATAEVEVVPAASEPPDARDTGAASSAALAALVADEGPRRAPEPASTGEAGDGPATSGEQAQTGEPAETAEPAETGEPAVDLNERVAELEDEVAAAPTAEAAAEAGARLAAAEDAATAQDVAEARAALGPDLTAGAAALGRKVAVDDLKVVEGIGPRIEEVLKESGINTWTELAATAPDRLRTILDLAGDQFRIHDPVTWPRQAGLAAEGRWDELVELQADLSGGRPS